MNHNPNNRRIVSFKDRAAIRLFALFLITFLTFFIGWLIYDIFNSMFEKQLAEQNMPNQPAVVVIDPKLETELTKVLTYDSLPEIAAVKDPFADPGGISGLTKTTANVITPQQIGVKTGNTPAAQNLAAANQTRTDTPRRNSSGNQLYGNNPQNTVVEDTKMRLTTWEQNGRFTVSGEPEPQIFAVEDLIPVGVVSGGDEQKEVMFYSLAADRTLSFPVGTRFYDAWLMEVRDDGVVFTFNDTFHTSRLKSWGRSVKSGGTGE